MPKHCCNPFGVFTRGQHQRGCGMAHLIGRALFHAQMAEMREARKQVTFAIFSEEEDLNKVTVTVDALFTLLQRSYKA